MARLSAYVKDEVPFTHGMSGGCCVVDFELVEMSMEVVVV